MELLRNIPLVAGLPEHEFDELLSHLVLHTVPRNEVIMRQNDTVLSLFLIARGKIELFRESGGNKHEIATLGAGDFFGEMGLLSGNKLHSATARAVTPSSVYELKRPHLESLCERHPSIRNKLNEILQSRLQGNTSGDAPDRTPPTSDGD